MVRVFLLSATRFGLRCLDAIEACGQDVVGCAWTPRRFSISYAPKGVENVNYVDYREVAEVRGIPCIRYERGNPLAFRKAVEGLRPDLLLAAGWYYLLDAKLRGIAPAGAVGIHGSCLPRYRGGAPLVWQMIRGERSAGASLFYLEDGVDTGDVIGMRQFPIEEADTIADVMARMEEAAVGLLREFLPQLAEGTAPRHPQREEDASIFPQRSPEDGEIDWTRPAPEIRNFIRAQTRPYPGAFTRIAGKKVIVWDADIVDEGSPGEVP